MLLRTEMLNKRARACVCVCVCERERERETDRETDRESPETRILPSHVLSGPV